MSRQSRVCIPVNAGLGNQLFQYAAGLAYSRRHNRRLVLDSSWYLMQRYRPRRHFLLDQFRIPEAASSFWPLRVRPAVAWVLARQRMRGKSNGVWRAAGMSVIEEQDFHRRDERLYEPPPPGDVCLPGSWQTVDHFLSVAGDLRQTIRTVAPPSPSALEWASRIEATLSCFVHVRRGDFVTLGHPVLPVGYYSAAADSVVRMAGTAPAWFVFSDDLPWCRANLQLPGSMHFVSVDSPRAEVEELLLMTRCRAGIVANSSFSWWGGALGESTERIVAAPRFRYGSAGEDLQRERVLPGWILIG